MLGIFIVPTGIGAEIGGHAGDATPAAKLIAECCDQLIVHPNVVNASDINEMTSNMLYVDGAMLDQFLDGNLNLEMAENRNGGNKILLVANKPLRGDTINVANAARLTIGANIEVVELDTPLMMIATKNNGIADGEVYGYEEFIKQIKNYQFDALALHTPVEVPREMSLGYFRNGGVNPWGGVEAKGSRMISEGLEWKYPVAHAPIDTTSIEDEELMLISRSIVDPRMAAEAMSIGFMHCVIKGLHTAPLPRKSGSLSNKNISFLVSPDNCWGRPHKSCMKKNILIITVAENTTVINAEVPSHPNVIKVDTYLEAAGIIMAIQAKILPESVRWPRKILEK